MGGVRAQVQSERMTSRPTAAGLRAETTATQPREQAIVETGTGREFSLRCWMLWFRFGTRSPSLPQRVVLAAAAEMTLGISRRIKNSHLRQFQGRGLLRRCGDLGGPVGPEGASLALARFRSLSSAPQSSQQHRQWCGSRPQALRGHIFTCLYLLAAGGPRGELAAVEGDVGGKDALADTGGGSSARRP
jgi:hypothetical protein